MNHRRRWWRVTPEGVHQFNFRTVIEIGLGAGAILAILTAMLWL